MPEQNDKILFIITGGTIDSLADGYNGISVFEEGQQSIIPEYINSKFPDNDCEFSTVCMKDSGDITHDETIKNNIIKLIDESDTNKVIITHGTDTMPDTASFINSTKQNEDAVVVMVGAMSPLRADDTDGYKNLDFAVRKVQELDSGVFIAMHRQVFDAGNVRKDFEKKKFVELAEKQDRSIT